MTLEHLFRIAEETHTRLTVEFNPGHDAKHPGRGYLAKLGDDDRSIAIRLRLDDAIQDGIVLAFERGTAQTSTQEESTNASKASSRHK